MLLYLSAHNYCIIMFQNLQPNNSPAHLMSIKKPNTFREILLFLNFADLSQVGFVCHSFRKISNLVVEELYPKPYGYGGYDKDLAIKFSQDSEVKTLATSGNTIISVSKNALCIWDIASQKLKGEHEGFGGIEYVMPLLHDGIFITSNFNSINFWNANNKNPNDQLFYTLELKEDYHIVSMYELDPGYIFLSISQKDNYFLHLLTYENGFVNPKLKEILKEPDECVYKLTKMKKYNDEVCDIKNYNLLSCNKEGRIKVWDIEKILEKETDPERIITTNMIDMQMVILNNTQFLTFSRDPQGIKSLKLWDLLQNGQEFIKNINEFDNSTTCLYLEMVNKQIVMINSLSEAIQLLIFKTPNKNNDEKLIFARRLSSMTNCQITKKGDYLITFSGGEIRCLPFNKHLGKKKLGQENEILYVDFNGSLYPISHRGSNEDLEYLKKRVYKSLPFDFSKNGYSFYNGIDCISSNAKISEAYAHRLVFLKKNFVVMFAVKGQSFTVFVPYDTKVSDLKKMLLDRLYWCPMLSDLEETLLKNIALTLQCYRLIDKKVISEFPTEDPHLQISEETKIWVSLEPQSIMEDIYDSNLKYLQSHKVNEMEEYLLKKLSQIKEIFKKDWSSKLEEVYTAQINRISMIAEKQRKTQAEAARIVNTCLDKVNELAKCMEGLLYILQKDVKEAYATLGNKYSEIIEQYINRKFAESVKNIEQSKDYINDKDGTIAIFAKNEIDDLLTVLEKGFDINYLSIQEIAVICQISLCNIWNVLKNNSKFERKKHAPSVVNLLNKLNEMQESSSLKPSEKEVVDNFVKNFIDFLKEINNEIQFSNVYASNIGFWGKKLKKEDFPDLFFELHGLTRTSAK